MNSGPSMEEIHAETARMAARRREGARRLVHYFDVVGAWLMATAGAVFMAGGGVGIVVGAVALVVGLMWMYDAGKDAGKWL